MGKLKGFDALAKIHNLEQKDIDLINLSSGVCIGPDDRYEILQLVDVGSTGAVYIARDQYLQGESVALKILLSQVIKNPKVSTEQFVDTLSHLQENENASLVEINDFWDLDNYGILTMEWMEWPNLYNWIKPFYDRGEYISLELACKIGLLISQAIQSFSPTSEHHLIHSRNVFISHSIRQTRIKISDYGIALLHESESTENAYKELDNCGWQSPERQSTHTLTPKQDVYSIASLIYWMLCFEYPSYEEFYPLSQLRPEIPATFDSILKKALHQEPSKRYCNLAEFTKYLEEFLNNPNMELTEDFESEEESTDEFGKFVSEGEIFAKNREWLKTIEAWNQALAIRHNIRLEEKLDEAKMIMQHAIELKEKAVETEPSEIDTKINTAQESLDLYPHDKELASLLQKWENEKNEKETRFKKILEEGDELARSENYLEAMEQWQRALAYSNDDQEIEDRIMQVVDLLGELAREALDGGDIYEAQNFISQAIPFTEDPLIEDLAREIDVEIRENETRFEEAMKEGEKHFAKKQFDSAAEVWKSTLGYTDKDELLQQKIKEAEEMSTKMDNDEQEYTHLRSMVKNLEQKEEYSSALQTLEKIYQKKDEWLCPVRDIEKEIERMTKLSAAMTNSQRAREILIQINKQIQAKNFKKAKQLYAEPIFRRQLVPSVERRYNSIKKQMDEAELAQAKKKKLFMAIGVVVVLVAIAAVVFF